MSRVSDNSSKNAINYSISKTKERLEDLQLKGSNLKRIQKPSDDPVGNVELLSIRSQMVDSNQYLRNSNFAKTNLEFTESALDELTEVLSKAKEIAVGQASDIYNPEIRSNVAKEIGQLKNQALAISNRRLGNRFIFAGYKTLTRPFDNNGKYLGDNGKINLEVNKDYFLPINLNGSEVFITNSSQKMKARSLNNLSPAQIDSNESTNESTDVSNREPANQTNTSNEEGKGLFNTLSSLENALLTNNPDIIQDLLEVLDADIDHVVKTRTEAGSILNSIRNAENSIENFKLQSEAYKSKIEDADVAELFSDLSRQQNALNASYKASSNLLNKSLLDFVR
jgi:flagellar hook-associated protein 3 FlgL